MMDVVATRSGKKPVVHRQPVIAVRHHIDRGHRERAHRKGQRMNREKDAVDMEAEEHRHAFLRVHHHRRPDG